jgi:hypothetical protein
MNGSDEFYFRKRRDPGVFLSSPPACALAHLRTGKLCTCAWRDTSANICSLFLSMRGLQPRQICLIYVIIAGAYCYPRQHLHCPSSFNFMRVKFLFRVIQANFSPFSSGLNHSFNKSLWISSAAAFATSLLVAVHSMYSLIFGSVPDPLTVNLPPSTSQVII